MSMKIVMMATGEFALPSFQALVESEHEVVALITQPDRLNPRGKPHPHPLKEFAISREIPVLQPESIKTPEAIKKLQSLRPDVVAVAAYGQILNAEVIRIPRLGMYNLHASLLPRHRGAAPIQYAVWKGDETTGVTIFQIEPKLDAGPMIVKRETVIGPEETSGELHDRLAVIGAEAFLEALQLIEAGRAEPLPQNAELVTQSPKIRKEQGAIDWSLTGREIDCHIRAMQPWPNAFTFLHQTGKQPERLLILKTKPVENPGQPNGKAGQILEGSAGELLVRSGDGVLSVLMVQKAGKKPMRAADFVRGVSLSPNDWLGPEEKEVL